MPNPPARSPSLSLAQIPAWDEVESDPQFAAADAPTRLATFNNWREALLDASLQDDNAFTGSEFDQFQIFTRRKAAELSGAPTWQQDADRAEAQYIAEEEARQKSFQEAVNRRPNAAMTAARAAVEAAGAGMLPLQPMAELGLSAAEAASASAEQDEGKKLREVLQDEESFAVFGGRFIASPSLVLNKAE